MGTPETQQKRELIVKTNGECEALIKVTFNLMNGYGRA